MSSIEALEQTLASVFFPSLARRRETPTGELHEKRGNSAILIFVGTKLDLVSRAPLKNLKKGEPLSATARDALLAEPQICSARRRLNALFEKYGTWPHYMISSLTGFGVEAMVDCAFRTLLLRSGTLSRRQQTPAVSCSVSSSRKPT